MNQIPGTAPRRAEVLKASLPAAQGASADVAPFAPLPGTALYQAAKRTYAAPAEGGK